MPALYIVADARGFVRSKPAIMPSDQLSFSTDLERIIDDVGNTVIPSTLILGQQSIAGMLTFNASSGIAEIALPTGYESNTRWNSTSKQWTFTKEDFAALAWKIEQIQSSASFLALPNTIRIKTAELILANASRFLIQQAASNPDGVSINLRAFTMRREGDANAAATFVIQDNGPVLISTPAPVVATVDASTVWDNDAARTMHDLVKATYGNTQPKEV